MKRILQTIILITAYCSVFAQQERLKPNIELTISEGLAHNGITSILEDSKGYLWVGTFDGLNLYDGYAFSTYRNTLGKKILVSNRVRCLAEDFKGNIWIGTDEGISIYNYQNERLHTIYERPKQKGPFVLDIIIDKLSQKIYAITEDKGVFVFDNNYKLIQTHILPKTLKKGMVNFNAGTQIASDRLVLTSPNGLYSLNLKNGDFNQILKAQINHCIDIIMTKNRHLLIAGNNGLTVVEFKVEQEEYAYAFKQRILKQQALRSVNVDQQNNVWIGKFRDGVIRINNLDNLLAKGKIKTKHYHLDAKLVRCSCITPSKNRGCWVGTFNRGLLRFESEDNPFKHYSTDLADKNGLSSDEILHISPINWYQAYVSAHSGGIGIFNFKEEHFEPLKLAIAPNLLERVGVISNDDRENTWLRISSNQGICYIRKGSNKLEKVSSKDYPDFSRLSLRSIVSDQYGQLWLGGEEDLFRVKLNRENDIVRVESLSKHPLFEKMGKLRIRSLYKDPHHNYLWVGTKENGLFRITTERNTPVEALQIKHYIDEKGNNLTPSAFISSIIRLPNNDLWIATERGGIAQLIENETSSKFVVFSEKHGLSNNVVKSIQYDDDYNLWITTNIGLNKFNTKENTFRVFKKSDGLPFEDFTNAGVKLKNGTMVFSGLEGFCYFDPKEVKEDDELPQVDFGHFKLYNHIVHPGDTIKQRVLLDQRLNDVQEITLKHDENVFALEVNALHYSNPINHFLRYQLLPINDNWIEVTSDQKEVHYNGLPPGEYTFRVMASNSLDKWTEPKELKIIIQRPYWLTPIAFIIYFLLVALIVYVIIVVNLRMQSLSHNLEIEQLEKEKGKEVNAAKLRFFSNISHEIKTPITLISGPVNVLADRFKHHPDVSEKLNIVRRQSRKISQLVDQVHDFQRADANQLKMNFSTFSFDNFIKDVEEDFSFLAENERKTLKVERQAGDTFVKADEDKLSKIINNLLSNAFKFTGHGDEILIDYYQNDKELVVVVKDNGKGIAANDLPHIFERFFQSQKMKKEYSGGSGIGLAFSKRLVEMHYGFITAESTEGQGTTMTIKLPIVVEGSEEDQYLAEERILESEKNFVSKKMQDDKAKLSEVAPNEDLKEASIFLVEDNTDMRLFVQETLSNFFTVKTFVNGKECLTALEEEWPDLIVSDVLMPEMNGFELTRAIKSDIKTSHIPVILLTACTVIDDQIKGIREGADAYIMKPFDIEHLVTRISTLLNARTQLRERFEANLPLQLKKEDDSAKDVVFLEKLYQLMNENLGNLELDLNQFARELYLNRTHFYQKVKALTNQTPYELLKNYRLKKAAELLVNEKLPVNEVIDATGFKSRSHFIKSFKERYNTTPGKYAQGIEESMKD